MGVGTYASWMTTDQIHVRRWSLAWPCIPFHWQIRHALLYDRPHSFTTAILRNLLWAPDLYVIFFNIEISGLGVGDLHCISLFSTSEKVHGPVA